MLRGAAADAPPLPHIPPRRRPRVRVQKNDVDSIRESATLGFALFLDTSGLTPRIDLVPNQIDRDRSGAKQHQLCQPMRALKPGVVDARA
jgi:hypothetical protein